MIPSRLAGLLALLVTACQPAPVRRLAVGPMDGATVPLGLTFGFTAAVLGTDTIPAVGVAWVIIPESLATVDNAGGVTGRRVGTGWVRATLDLLQDSVPLTVVDLPVFQENEQSQRRARGAAFGAALQMPMDTVFVWVMGDVGPGGGTATAGQLLDTICIKAGGYGRCSDPLWSGGVRRLPFVFIPGDVCYDHGYLSECVGVGDRTHMARKTTKRQWFVVPGNHEYNSVPNALQYFAYMGNRDGLHPPAIRAIGDSLKYWWSANLGAYWHIIGLNMNGSSTPSKARGQPQQVWLAADLAANTRPCIVSMQHDNLWSDANNHKNYPADSVMWNTLYAAHSDVVIGGHDHIYERFAAGRPGTGGVFIADVAGPVEIISGMGGNGNYDGCLSGCPNNPHEAMFAKVCNTATPCTAIGSSIYGAVLLTLGPGWWKWKWVPTSGASADSGGPVSCHPKS